MALSAEQIADALSEYRDLPRIERERYRKKQWRVIEPGTAAGDYHGLTRQDWWLDSFLATDGEWVEISLIRAKHRGHGAFSKLLNRLEDELQLKVRIVCPLAQMKSILLKKGFVARTEGTTFENTIDL